MKLSDYNNTHVRIFCKDGESLMGTCTFHDAEYGLLEYGREEDFLEIGDTIVFAGEIEDIVLFRREVCVPVRDWPEAKEEIAAWFHQRWRLPPETYRASVRDCLGNEDSLPQWYVVVRGNDIIAGCGVIENDFHTRPDLTPNVCAVYVDEAHRGQGVAGYLLRFVCDDMAALGYDTLYLLTDHIGFYERCGWQFHSMVRGYDGALSRMYVHRGKRGEYA